MADVASHSALEREGRIGMHFSLVEAYLESRGLAPLERPSVSLKTLYSDFVVREISPLYHDGAPLVLEPLPPLGVRAEKRPRKESESAETIPPTDLSFDESLLRERFSPLIPSCDMNALVAAIRDMSPRVVLSASLDKTQRTAVHRAVAEVLAATHVSSTESGAVVVARANAAARRESARRGAPRHFLHFTLYKENADSNQVLRQLARYLGVPVRQLLFSGTKDKRAVTLQRVAVRGLAPERLASVNERSFGPDSRVRVCGFSTMPDGLRLGSAVGNHFRIALRYLSGISPLSPMLLDAARTALTKVGAINYYGPQRFGTTSVLTSDVGLRLLAGDFETAFHLVMRSKSFIVPDVAAALTAVERHDFAEALKVLPRYCLHERDMLRHLVNSPGDFMGAFHALPRTLGMLYCHAVQSLIWNVMASRRLALEGGLSPMEGDLVLKYRYETIKSRQQNLKEGQQCQNGNGPTNNHNENKEETHCHDDQDFGMNTLPKEGDGPLPDVVHLSATDVASGAFHLSDVLLPVPGPDTRLQYPDNVSCSREAYTAELAARAADGLMRADNPLVKVYHYHGSYRPLCVRLPRLKMETVETSGPREPIILTDLESLARSDAEGEGFVTESRQETITPSEGKHKAIVVEFSLPPGSYATSVLREFCVCSSEGYHTAGENVEEEGEGEGEVEPSGEEEEKEVERN